MPGYAVTRGQVRGMGIATRLRRSASRRYTIPALTRTTRNVLVIGRLSAVNPRVSVRPEARGYVAIETAGEGTFDALDARELNEEAAWRRRFPG